MQNHYIEHNKGGGRDLACLGVSDEDVSGCQVSVDKGLATEVLHSSGHLDTELGEESPCLWWRELSRTERGKEYEFTILLHACTYSVENLERRYSLRFPL